MNAPNPDLGAGDDTAAAWIAKFLQARGIDRVFGLQGGHIQPIWDWLGRLGIRIVDVRDEGAAVHMAHAHAELTGGFGVAMVTAGPGVTNCVTAMANASLARVPVMLIGGCTPAAAGQHGAAAGHPACRHPAARHASVAHAARRRPGAARAGRGRGPGHGRPGEPGPVYLEIPTDVLRHDSPPALAQDDWLAPEAAAPDAAGPGAG